jgi:hypothetical protein
MGFEFATQTLSLADSVVLSPSFGQKSDIPLAFWTPIGLPIDDGLWFWRPTRE